MTHDYKAALTDYCYWLADARMDEDGDATISTRELFGSHMCEHHKTIRAALQLAQEAEQLKSQRVFKANIDEVLAQEIIRTSTMDGAICAFTIPRDELVEQLRKENDRLRMVLHDVVNCESGNIARKISAMALKGGA